MDAAYVRLTNNFSIQQSRCSHDKVVKKPLAGFCLMVLGNQSDEEPDYAIAHLGEDC